MYSSGPTQFSLCSREQFRPHYKIDCSHPFSTTRFQVSSPLRILCYWTVCRLLFQNSLHSHYSHIFSVELSALFLLSFVKCYLLKFRLIYLRDGRAVISFQTLRNSGRNSRRRNFCRVPISPLVVWQIVRYNNLLRQSDVGPLFMLSNCKTNIIFKHVSSSAKFILRTVDKYVHRRIKRDIIFRQ
jgi:hypothetical protein